MDVVIDGRKFALPVLPRFVLERERLEKRLDSALDDRLTLICAPAGYGKSVLTAQWASQVPDIRVSWLTIDGRDNDVSHLASHLLVATGLGDEEPLQACLETIGPGMRRFGTDFTTELVGQLRATEPLILVLDELEALTEPGLVEDLITIVEEAPDHVHVVALTRVAPPAPLHRLRLADVLAELDQHDLALDVAQARSLVERVSGVAIDDAQAARLHRLTEGWPAALHLAALALRHADDADAEIAAFGRGDRSLASYLAEEVLGQLDQEVEDFLLTVSVLPRLRDDLCDATTTAPRCWPGSRRKRCS